jgi:GAF sensor signal transduction histidine kinase (EC 2.7.13.3)
LLLERTLYYRPELAEKVEQAYSIYGIRSVAKKSKKSSNPTKSNSISTDYSSLNDPFAYRLVTYLQAGQHELLRVYRSLAAKERKERLVNSITATIRQSTKPARSDQGGNPGIRGSNGSLSLFNLSLQSNG